ncbi:hypothetical protein HZA43_03280, partial [Candidatus Peregrinibacteria bacterium]|nr:hypothetical protein [Candidatus Peregrinibacteria bacterium]
MFHHTTGCRLPLVLLFVPMFFSVILVTPWAYADEAPIIQLTPEGGSGPVQAASDELIIRYSDGATLKDRRDVRNENELTAERVPAN